MTTHQNAHAFHNVRVLVTAGPTREPIDDVRFIGNRSSGQLGIRVASTAVELGLQAHLILSNSVQIAPGTTTQVSRFETTADLQQILRNTMPSTDILVMAAAVADHTPRHPVSGKLPNASREAMTLDLVPTPDLLAEVAAAARPDQLLVGFALEPADRLLDSAQRKLARKAVDIIVANPLETMDADTIDATIVAVPTLAPLFGPKPGIMTKAEFSHWLWPRLIACHQAKGNQ